jgi:hypothetical protein
VVSLVIRLRTGILPRWRKGAKERKEMNLTLLNLPGSEVLVDAGITITLQKSKIVNPCSQINEINYELTRRLQVTIIDGNSPL